MTKNLLKPDDRVSSLPISASRKRSYPQIGNGQENNSAKPHI